MLGLVADEGASRKEEVDLTAELHMPLKHTGGQSVQVFTQGEERQVGFMPKMVPGLWGKALHLGETSPVELGDVGDFESSEGFSYGAFIYLEGKPNGAILARMDPDQQHRGWDLWVQNGQIGAHVIDQWPDQAVKAYTKEALQPKRWYHIFVVYDPSQTQSRLSIYVDGRPAAITYSHNQPGKNIRTQVPLTLGSRNAGKNRLTGTLAVQDIRIVGRVMKQEEVRKLMFQVVKTSGAKESASRQGLLRKVFDAEHPATPSKSQQRLLGLQQEKKAMMKRGNYTLIMQEHPKQKPFAHVLDRGLYSAKGEKVLGGVPSALPALKEGQSRDRLGLAQWLVDKRNPLTARVTVNRYWHYLFGRGIVETTEDFGIMGERPSHPELLDWLASEFVEQKWDLQHLLRLMITSKTYRQSAVMSPEKKKVDPLNIWMTRSSRDRLHGEQLRDMVLSVSGLLVEKVGGAPVRPYQPNGIWEAVAMNQSNTRFYKKDSGDKLYRRSIYTIWKRTAPHPAMELLDAPARETFCVRREKTNTPLAAFVMMNDVQFVEASRILATKALKAEKGVSQRMDYLSMHLISRHLEDDEKKQVAQTLDTALQKYRADPDLVKKLIGVGERPPDDTVDPAELAAWTLVASQLLNLDETLTK